MSSGNARPTGSIGDDLSGQRSGMWTDGLFGLHDELLRIGDCEFLSRGAIREVYQHPFQNGLLIKVIRPELIDAGGEFIGTKSRRVARRRQLQMYSSFAREMREMFRVGRRSFPVISLYPFCRVYGLVETTLGLVVEKIMAPDGSPAPTLSEIVKSGRLTDKHRMQLDAFSSYASVSMPSSASSLPATSSMMKATEAVSCASTDSAKRLSSPFTNGRRAPTATGF